MRTTIGLQTFGPNELRRTPLPRRDLRSDDIAVRVDYCGVCAMCEAGHENFCRSFPTLTYGGTDRQDGSPTLGGYSREYVVRDALAYPLPPGLDPAAAAPLRCAGNTVWESLRSFGVGPGSRVAIAGLGGLGGLSHLAVKLAVALGATTTVISRTQDKRGDARLLGAHGFIASTDAEQMAAARDGFDVIIDTISAPHDLAPYLRLVALDGALSLLGHRGCDRPAHGPQEAYLRGQRGPPADRRDAPVLRRQRHRRRYRGCCLRHRWRQHSTACGETTSVTASSWTSPTWTETSPATEEMLIRSPLPDWRWSRKTSVAVIVPSRFTSISSTASTSIRSGRRASRAPR